jgi:outer membrane cobalamin receptor
MRPNVWFRRLWSLVLSLAIVAGTGSTASAARKGATRAAEVEEILELPIEDLFNTMITTATKMDERAENAPATAYVITAEQIKRLGLRDLKDILAIVPGVDVVDPHFWLEGGQRGFVGPFSQTLLMINGREMNNLIAGETFISEQFRVANIKQVEIIAGPGSALYGANAVAGIINIITKTDEDVDGVEVSAGCGSFGTREMSAVFGSRRKDFRVHGSVVLFQTDGEDFSDFLSETDKASPLAPNNAYRRLPDRYGYDNPAESLAASLHVENKGVYAGAEYYRNRTGRGTSGIQWDYTQGEDYRELLMNYLGVRREGLWKDQVDVKAEYRYYWEQFWGNHTESDGPIENPYTEETDITDPTDADIAAFRGFYSNQRSPGSKRHVLNPEATWRVVDWNTLIGGLNYEESEIVGAQWSRTEKPHPKPGAFQTQAQFSNYKWGAYLQDQARLLEDRLVATLGARYDDHERYDSTFNPRCGLVFKATEKTILKLLYGKSFREPTVFELGTDEATTGNAEPMKMQTYELGWHQYLGKHLKNEAVAFHNKAEDLILADSTFGGYLNGGELESEGFEDVLSFTFGSVKGFLNYTYTRSEQTDIEGLKTDVYDIPAHKANLAVMWEFIKDYSVGLTARYRDEVDTEYYGTIYTVDDYLVYDATFNILKLPWLDADASLDVICKNVLDEEYYHPEPRAPTALQHPQEGRSFVVKLTVKI